MNATRLWGSAFVLTSLVAAALVLAAGRAAPEPVAPRDPAKLAPVDAELLLNRIREGDLLAIKGDLPAARVQWNAAREKGEGYWPIHEALGDSLARHRLDVEAEREYATSARIAEAQLGRAPDGVKVKRADLLVRLKRPDEALRLLIDCGAPDRLGPAMARILEASPALMDIVTRAAEVRDPRLWAVVASLAKDPADRASAIGRFSRAVAPWDGGLARRAVDELRGAKLFDAALIVCRDWAKAAPNDPSVYETWSDLVAQGGDLAKARRILTTIVDVRPGDPEAHRRLGVALRKWGAFAEALEQFEEVGRLRPEEPTALKETIVTLAAQGKIEEAMERYRTLTGKKKWDSRFGDVGAATRATLADECGNLLESARRTGNPEAVTRLRRFCADLGIAEAGLFDLKVIMRWDAASDVDLDVTDPRGETVNHGNARSKAGAFYSFDNTTGYGPEHVTLKLAPKGKYRVGVHLHGSIRSSVEIEVILFEETPRERRIRERVVLDGGHSQLWPIEFEIP